MKSSALYYKIFFFFCPSVLYLHETLWTSGGQLIGKHTLSFTVAIMTEANIIIFGLGSKFTGLATEQWRKAFFYSWSPRTALSVSIPMLHRVPAILVFTLLFFSQGHPTEESHRERFYNIHAELMWIYRISMQRRA